MIHATTTRSTQPSIPLEYTGNQRNHLKRWFTWRHDSHNKRCRGGSRGFVHAPFKF